MGEMKLSTRIKQNMNIFGYLSVGDLVKSFSTVCTQYIFSIGRKNDTYRHFVARDSTKLLLKLQKQYKYVLQYSLFVISTITPLVHFKTLSGNQTPILTLYKDGCIT